MMRDTILDNLTVWVHSIDGKFYTKEEREELTRKETAELDLYGSVKVGDKLIREGVYKAPLQRIDNDKSCFVWRDAATGKPLKDKRYL